MGLVPVGDAYREDVIPTTGGYHDVTETIRRRVSALTRDYNNMFVGITSDGEDRIRARWNEKYKGLGFKNIAWLYSTTSDPFHTGLERELTDFYGPLLDNERGGGGGRPPSSTPYVVYLAWK